MKMLLSRAALALALLALLPAVASAHAELLKSDPAAGAKLALANAPSKISLTMSEDMAREGATIQVLLAGTDYAAATPVTDFDNPKLVSVALKPLSAGTYTVKWRTITAEDSGSSNGQFSFTITDAGGTAPATGPTGPTGDMGTPATPAGGTELGTSTLPTTGAATTGGWLYLLLGAMMLLGLGLVLRLRRA